MKESRNKDAGSKDKVVNRSVNSSSYINTVLIFLEKFVVLQQLQQKLLEFMMEQMIKICFNRLELLQHI